MTSPQKRLAEPKDYIEWGGACGLETAKVILKMPADSRKARIDLADFLAQMTAADFVSDGASADEGALYVRSFRSALSAQLENPGATIKINAVVD